MQLAVSTLACPDWTLRQIVEAFCAHSIEGIEFRGLGAEIDITRSPEFTASLPETLTLLERSGLKAPCFASSVTLVSPGPERWQAMLDEAHRYAVLAPQTRTSFLRIFGGAATAGVSDEEALTMARRHLRQIIKICKPRGLTPLLETHNSLTASLAMRRLIGEFDPAEVGVLWDIEHTTRAGESPADVVETLSRWMRYIHFKDSVLDPNADGKRKKRPMLMGQGDLPLTEALKALQTVGYEGWISLESEKRWLPDAAPEPEVAIPHFAAYMRALQ